MGEFVDSEGLYAPLERGDVILVRSSFLKGLYSSGGRLLQRQQIEADHSDAIVSTKELRRMHRMGHTFGGFRAMPVVAVSYCWETPEHPDPAGYLLAALGKEAALELVSIFREKQMTSVGLGGCSLGADGAKAVAEYLQLSGSLTSLDVNGSNKLDAASKELLRDTVKDRSGFELKM